MTELLEHSRLIFKICVVFYGIYLIYPRKKEFEISNRQFMIFILLTLL